MAEAHTPGRFEEDRPESADRPSSDDSFLPGSHWFSASGKEKFSNKWKPGRYKYSFFNEFNPKNVFDGRKKENHLLRKKIITSIIDKDFDIDIHSSYYKKTSLKRSVREDIVLGYNEQNIAIYSPKDNSITPISSKAFRDFQEDISVTHNFKSTQEIRPQVQKKMEEDRNFDIDKEIELIDKRLRTEKDDEGRILRYVDDILINDEEPINSRFYDGKNPFKKGVISTAFQFLKNTASDFTKGSTDFISNISRGDPTDTVIRNVKTDINIERKIHQGSVELQMRNLRDDIRDRDREIDELNERNRQLSQTIGNLKKEISTLENAIRQASGDKDVIGSLQSQIDDKNEQLYQMERAFDNLKEERDRILNSSHKALNEGDIIISEQRDKIQTLQTDLDLTGKQILEKDQEIEDLKTKLAYVKEFADKNANEYDNLNSEIEGYRKTISDLESQYKNLSDSYKNKIQELENVIKSSIENSSETANSIKDLLEKEKKKSKDLKAFQDSLEVKNKVLEENIRLLSANYEAELVYSSDLKEQKSRLISELELLKDTTEINNLDSSKTNEIQELRQNLKSFENDLATEKSFSSDLQKQRDKIEKSYNDIKNNFNSFKEQSRKYAKTMQKDLDDSRVEKDLKDNLEKEVKDLNESLVTYKSALEALTEKNKKDLENQAKKLQESNDQVKDLQSKLSNNEITIKEYRRKLQESENQFQLAKSRYDSSISQRSQNVDLLLQEKQILQERNSLLENDLEHYKSRILDKDIEVQGYLDQIRDLKDNIENLGNTISKQDLYAEQFNVLKARFDRLTLNHNDLVHKANQTQLDRDELEVEIEKISKQLQETKTELDNVKKNRLDPRELEEARNHVRELAQELRQRENTLRQKANELKEIEDEAKKLRNHIQVQKNDYEKEMLVQKEHYEDKLKRQDREIRNKMRNYIRPGEIRL